MLAVVACNGGRDVAVRVSVIGADSAESPVPGATLAALPFDRDSLLHALELRAGTTRPHAAELDTIYARFRQPFIVLSEASQQAEALRDSVTAIGAATAGAPAAALRARLKAAEAHVDSARQALAAVRAATAPRADSLRRSMAQWEHSTYAAYESLAGARLRATGRDVPADTTGADGWARVHLPPGDWWIYAASWDVTDPNRYWYWNVHVSGDTLRLNARNGVRKPRY